jgi:hypothetical protein
MQNDIGRPGSLSRSQAVQIATLIDAKRDNVCLQGRGGVESIVAVEERGAGSSA